VSQVPHFFSILFDPAALVWLPTLVAIRDNDQVR
jgi:hypothetical protein